MARQKFQKKIFKPTILDFHENSAFSESELKRIISLIGKVVKVYPNCDPTPIKRGKYKGQYRWQIKGLDFTGDYGLWYPCEDFVEVEELTKAEEKRMTEYVMEIMESLGMEIIS